MRDADLLLRQQLLQLRSAQLRDTLAADAKALERPLQQLHRLHRVLSLFEWCVQRPHVPLLALGVLLGGLRFRGAMRWGRRLTWLWQVYRQLRPLLAVRNR